jgi:hypothetical protein
MPLLLVDAAVSQVLEEESVMAVASVDKTPYAQQAEIEPPPLLSVELCKMSTDEHTPLPVWHTSTLTGL